MKRMVMLVLAVAAASAFAKDYYINPDPSKASNSYDGTAKEWQGGTVGPKLTYASLYGTGRLLQNGDVVHAARGVYDSGELVMSSHKYRVVLPAGVTLVADEGAAVTTIRGLADGDTTASPWGCGANAVSGVYLWGVDSMVKDFTIESCYAADYTAATGGGVIGYSKNGAQDSQFVVGCTITNCAAYRGGAVSYAVAIRSRFANNRASTGDDLFQCQAFSCFFGDGPNYSVYQHGPIVNCTFGGTGKHTNGNGTITLANCICLNTSANKSPTYTNTVVDTSASAKTTLKLSNDCHPLHGSKVINAGDATYYDECFPTSPVVADQKELDLDGNPRQLGDSIDQGCYEMQEPGWWTWYVDEKKGKDSNDGRTADTAFATLQAAMETPQLVAGDTVSVAAGTYSNGVMTAASNKYRAVVPAGVKLIGAGADVTTIVGEPDSTVALDVSPFGCGVNAVGGVYLDGADTLVKGFAFKECYACDNSNQGIGAGVSGASATKGQQFVVGCTFTDCSAYRGAGAAYAVVIRCRFKDNRAGTGDHVFQCQAFSCLFGDSPSFEAYQIGPIVNCTFAGTGKTTHGGENITLANCVCLKPHSQKPIYTNTVYDVTASTLRLSDDSHPLHGSKVINAGDSTYYDEHFPTSPVVADQRDLDLDGNPRQVGEAIDQGCFEMQKLGAWDWFVDANDGDDGNDGTTPQSAFKTLKAALLNASLVSNDVVHAAAGTYAADEDSLMLKGSDRYCAIVPAGVSLVADGAVDETFIVGAGDHETGTEETFWCGPKAICGAYLGAGSTLRGFTLTGARSTSSSSDPRGAVVAENTSAYLVGCVVTNNASQRGAGLYSGTAVNCLFADNYGSSTGNDLLAARAFGCVFGDVGHTDGYNSCNVYQGGPYVNCTFTGAGRSVSVPKDGNCTLYNCLCLKTSSGGITLVDSVTTQSSYVIGEGSVKVDDAAVDAENRPTAASPACDKAKTEHFQWLIDERPGLLETDFSGAQRVYNAAMDIGALECDMRPVYAKFLRGRSLTVDAAAPETALSDDGLLVRGEALAFTWDAGHGQLVVNVKATGDGTAKVFADGVLLLSCVAADGAQAVTVPESATETALLVAYEPSDESDDGGALLSPCGRIGGPGMLLIVR